MRKFLFVALVLGLSLLADRCHAQMPTVPSNKVVGLSELSYLLVPKVIVVPADTLAWGSDSVGMLARKGNFLYMRVLDPVTGIKKFVQVGSKDLKVPTGPVTSMPFVGMTHSNGDLEGFIQEAFFRAKPPLATLSGGTTVEKLGAGANLTYNLSWTATRQDYTAAIQSVVVAGVSVPNVSAIAAGQTSGSNQNVSVVRNQNTTFTITVTTVDGQSATASQTIAFSDKLYFGWVPSINPTDAELIAAGGVIATNNTKGWTQAKPATPQYVAMAFPTSFGLLTKFDINGIPSLPAMGTNGTPITRNLTNASGFTQPYYIYVTQNAQNGQAVISAD